jgi:amidase
MHFKSAAEQMRALDEREISSVELVDAAIARIEAADGAVNAVVVRDFERARAAAKTADAQRRSGEPENCSACP